MPKTQKHILFIDLGAPFGGVEVHTRDLAGMLRSRAKLFAICALPNLAEDLRSLGAKVICIPLIASPWYKPVRTLIAFFLVPYMLIRYSIDVVQTNGFFEAFLIPLIRALGRPVVFTMHCPFEYELYRWYRNPERYFPRLLAKYCMLLASRIVAVSETVGKLTRAGLPSKETVVIQNWVSSVPLNGRSDYTAGSEVTIVMAGRLASYKGFQLTLQAVRSFSNIKVIIVGEGPFRRDLEVLSEGLNVHFAGFSKDVSQYLEMADIFINPTLGPEGLPLISIEAMSHGLPCIFSDLPVHKEITEDGKGALLFQAGDTVDLERKITQFVSNREARLIYGQCARRLVLAKHTSQIASRLYLKALGLESEIEVEADEAPTAQMTKLASR